MQKVKRYLEIAQTIRTNVSESESEVALYLNKAFEELGEKKEELEKISNTYSTEKADKIIIENFKLLNNKIANETTSKELSFHMKGYLGGAAMILIIFACAHLYVQSEKLQRQTPLVAKFSPWLISYYCNDKLEGEPCKTEVMAKINANWEGNPPTSGVPGAPFSARFKSCVDFGDKKQEAYFSLGADDGYRLILDGKVLKEKWETQGFDPKIFSRKVSPGMHSLVIEYFQGGGASKLEFKVGSHRLNLAEAGINAAAKPDC